MLLGVIITVMLMVVCTYSTRGSVCIAVGNLGVFTAMTIHIYTVLPLHDPQHSCMIPHERPTCVSSAARPVSPEWEHILPDAACS